MESNVALILSYCLWTQICVFLAFFLCLALLDLAEKNKQDHMSTIFKLYMKTVNASGVDVYTS